MSLKSFHTEIILASVLAIVPCQVALAQSALSTMALVSWWAADGTADDSQDGNHGVLFNGASLAPGLYGQAFSFDGANDHVRVPDAPNLDTAGALTIEAWVYPTTFPTTYPTIVGKWDAVAVNHRSYVLHLHNSGRVYYRVSPNGLELGFGIGTVISNSAVPLNQWTHIAGVYDGTSMKIYINGVLDNQVAYNQGIVAGSDDFSIGGIVGGVPAGQSIAPFAGLIDEVRLYDCGLSAQQITSIVDTGEPGGCPIAVDIDIKPGSYPNSINLCSGGAVPVAIFGSAELNVLEIDPDTLRFAEASVKIVGKKDPQTLCSVEEKNDDLYDDLVCHYLTTNIAALGSESSSATVTGELLDGTQIEGTDSVNIVLETCQ